MKTKAKNWVKEKYFDEESGDWVRYDFFEAMEEYHKEQLREELIKFAQQFYADEETCIYNVDEYLKT